MMDSPNIVTIDELLLDFNGEYIPYRILLNASEWITKRTEILKRDNFKCTKCGHWTTEKMWDSKKRVNFYIWWGEDKPVIVTGQDGKQYESYLPEIIPAPKQYYLNIHHRYYVKNRLPWKYPNDALITLCNWCHDELHKSESITVFDEYDNEINDLTPCKRCSGAGWFPEYEHVEAGICFRCGGAKFEELINFKIR